MSASSALALFIRYLFNTLTFAILLRVLFSWIDPTGDLRKRDTSGSQILRILYDITFYITEPILAPIRSVLSSLLANSGPMMMDFSPLIAGVLLQMLGSLLLRAIAG